VRRWQLRNLGWSLAVLAVLAAVGYGLPAVNAALPAARPVPTDRPYDLGGRVSVVPPSGALLDVTRTRPGSTLFVVDGVRYLLVVAAADGTLDDSVGQLRQKISANRGYQVTGPETPVRTGQGVLGRQGGYTSPGRDGRYAVFRWGRTAVQVTIAGADPDLRRTLPALTSSVLTLAFGA
jgi:hypothetical protein